MRLAPPLAATAGALARLEERLRSEALRQGVMSRLDVADAVAALWLEGELVDRDDLILHGASMDARRPDLPLLRAHLALTARRRTGRLRAGSLPSPETILSLVGEADSPLGGGAAGPAPMQEAWADDPLGLRANPGEQRTALTAWREVACGLEDMPPALAAASAWLAWDQIDPLPRHGFVGALLAAFLLRQGPCLPPLAHGMRAVRLAGSTLRRGVGTGAFVDSLLQRLAAIEAGTRYGLDIHARLALAEQVLASRTRGGRSSSLLPDFIRLALEEPLVTAPSVARRLGVSQQAALDLVQRAGPSLREVSGRRRYRAWAVV